MLRQIISSSIIAMLVAFFLSVPVAVVAGFANLEQVESNTDALAEAERLTNEAFSFFQTGKVDKALPLIKESLAIREQILGEEHPDTIASASNLGLLLQRTGDLKKAKPYLERALSGNEKLLGPFHPATGTSLYNLGLLLDDMGDPHRARPYLERALEISQEVLDPKDPDIARILSNLGSVVAATGDLEGGKAYLERALAIREDVLGPNHPATAISLNKLGLLLQDMDDFKGAMPLLQRALTIRENVFGSKHPVTAESLNNIGLLYKMMGNFEVAKSHYERALDIREEMLGPRDPATAISLNNLGVLLKVTGNLNVAKRYYERALEIDKATFGLQHPRTARDLNNLGSLYQAMGDYKNAKNYYERSLEIRRKVLGLKHRSTALSFDNMGVLLNLMGDLEGAKVHFEQARIIRLEVLGLEHSDTAQSFHNMGGLMKDLKNYRQAKMYYEQALEIKEALLGPMHPDTALTVNNLGALLTEMGELETAKAYYERAQIIKEHVFGRDHTATAQGLNNLGMLLKDMGDIKGAENCLVRSLGIREKVLGDNHPDTASSLSNMAILRMALGQISEAVGLAKRALDAEENLLTAILTIGSETQKLAFLKKLVGSSYGVVSLHVDLAPKDERALRLAASTILRRKGRALDATVEALRHIRADLKPLAGPLLEALTTFRAQRAYLLLRPPDAMDIGERRARIEELENRIRTTEAQISNAINAFPQTNAPVTLETVQEKIPSSAALVEFFVYHPFDAKSNDLDKRWGEPHYVAYVLHRSGEPRWAALGPARQIDAATESFRSSVAKRSGDVLENGRKLDALTMAKVRPLIGDATKLLISPDSLLNLVPFAALVDEEGRYLIERYQLSYVTSGRDLLRSGGNGDAREKPLIVGDVAFGGTFGAADKRGDVKRSVDLSQLSFGGLPGTAKEVLAISQLLELPKERVLTEEEATEAAVKAVKGPGILHLATHGFFLQNLPDELLQPRPTLAQSPRQRLSDRLEDPLLRSGLALSGFNRRKEAQSANDGVLTALEVAGLDLWRTEVVVLSACETGVGEVRTGEGVFGLRRALVLAGAQSQLMTLWQVADEPTKELMVSWYGQLKQGKGRAEALHQAQLAALQGKTLPVTKKLLHVRGAVPVEDEAPSDPKIAGSRHPYYWGSFILSGVTGPINLIKK